MLHDDDNDADNGDDEQCCANKQNMEKSLKIRGKFQKGHGNIMENSWKFPWDLWKFYGKF